MQLLCSRFLMSLVELWPRYIHPDVQELFCLGMYTFQTQRLWNQDHDVAFPRGGGRSKVSPRPWLLFPGSLMRF